MRTKEEVYKEIAEALISFLEYNYDHSDVTMDLVEQCKEKLKAIEILEKEIH
jgi:hypothetical protein